MFCVGAGACAAAAFAGEVHVARFSHDAVGRHVRLLAGHAGLDILAEVTKKLRVDFAAFAHGGDFFLQSPGVSSIFIHHNYARFLHR